MATLNLRRFTNHSILTAIRPAHLLELLVPYRTFFASRDVDLPKEALNPNALPYAAIAMVLMSPDAATPPDLIEAFDYIQEMASPAGHKAMIEALEHGLIVIKVYEHSTALDMAVQFWLKDRRLLEQLHNEQNLAKPRSFDYYRADRDKPIAFKMPDDKALRRLEADLDHWFVKKQRGRAARVYAYGRPDGAWFLVRHGEPFKQENVIQDSESACIFFRPEKYYVIAYDAQAGEIRINARTRGERDLYRMIFGRHLFGSDHYFGEQSRFTLEPLRRDGRAALMCLDVHGLEYVRLKEIQFFWGGHYDEVKIHKAEDVFAAIEDRRVLLPKDPRVSKATFVVKFKDAKTERTATINSSNRAYYKCDDDAGILETWMRRRGFIIFGEDPTYAAQVVGLH